MRAACVNGLGRFSLAAGFLAAAGAPAAAATFTVQVTTDAVDTAPGDGLCRSGPSAQSCTLRAAVQEANALPGPDEIVVPPGTYALTLEGPAEDACASGDLDVTGPVTIRAANRLRPVLRRGSVSPGRILHVLSAGVKVQGVVIRDGFEGAGVGGAGIRVEAGAGLELSRVVVTANLSRDSAGALSNAGTLVVVDSRISDNFGAAGAGLFSAGTLTMRASTVENNGADAVAGGLLATLGTVRIADSTFSRNFGAAVQNEGADLHLASVTIADTTAVLGALHNGGGTTTVKNTIVAGTHSPLGAPESDCRGTVASEGHNLIGDAATCDFGTSTGDQVGSPSDPIDPLLGTLADNAGPTPTHALLAGSPALDAGNPAGCSDAAGQDLLTDQRGAPRAMEGDGAPPAVCDTGSYEHGALFADVPVGHFARRFVEDVHLAGVSGGCAAGPLRYCPDAPVTREQMAPLVLLSLELPGYAAPPCLTPSFDDVPCASTFARWIEEMVARGITEGCSASPSLFCPTVSLTRAEAAVFLLATREGPAYAPPPCTTARFDDVPCSSPFAPWINELAARGIAAGCSASPSLFCPAQPVSRAQMAVFLVATFGL